MKTVEETKAELRDTMQRSKEDAIVMPGNRFVIVPTEGTTPLRESTGSGRIAFYGDHVFSTITRVKAARVAADFNSKLEDKGSETRMVVMLSSVWKAAHIKWIDEVLNGMLK